MLDLTHIYIATINRP